ncbi:riboflavin synthase [Colwellia psychrerythraea]|uniref:Riboflavin synthase n=1 Tax=Colwellia psychrerythraea (strain 34H / ATCC BAA-681) TaxID=167879 RepID=Q488N3_COLP3|nr:riboflavin synthase [Colwellia psychrerythraea]AAZ26448.1 riboflavin synthase, alpha subunit [Colwellia psychrerythraea 34H]
MFTGIIEAVGTISAINVNAQGARLVIATNSLDMSDVKLGDSIATNGICLTVVDFNNGKGNGSYSADVSNETLQRTGFAGYKVGSKVNLEKAMLASTRFGGHMVSGHVDGVSEILAINNNGNSIEYWLSMPSDLAHYIAEKGSVTIDGTSLTVNALAEEGSKGHSQGSFRLTIVPHTVKETIFAEYQVGSKVNIEVDLIARYLERLLTKSGGNEHAPASNVTESMLLKAGFIK